MTVADTALVHLALKNTVENIPIHLVDKNGVSVDPTVLTLKLFDQYENPILQTAYTSQNGSFIRRTDVGQYYFPLGDTTIDPNNSTAVAKEFILVWGVVLPGGINENIVQVAKVVSVTTMRYLPRLRTIVDKAAKVVDENPDDPVFVGYTDAMLVQFLEGGLGWINAFQPYPMWATVDQFPEQHNRVLLDAAVCDALTSQELFAVDTDIPSYSDQGNTFVIDHQPKLSAILNTTWNRLVQVVPAMKRHYLHNGAVHIEIGPNFRFQALLNAAPSGSLFRNAFLGGAGTP